jgi:LPXTG-motif cell wall-anchored protein
VKRIAPLLIAAFAAAGFCLATPAHAVDATPKCAAYVDLCDEFPGDADQNCAPNGAIDHPVTLVNPANDPWDLDRDHDGIGCDDAGSASPTPTKSTPSPTKSASKAPTHRPSPTPSRSAVASGAGGSELPVTGTPAGVIAGGAAGLVMVGAVAAVVARRRRIRFNAE